MQEQARAGKVSCLLLYFIYRILLSFFQDACGGDSGGPIMAFVDDRWVLAGITSIGEGCGRARFPGVYTRVSAFVSFINSSMTGMTSEPNNDQSNSQGNMIHKSKYVLFLIFNIFLIVL